MIEFNKITKVYGKKTALSADQLRIHECQCVGVVGNNGAGKTTMLSLILDLIKATTGTVSFNGTPVSVSDNWKNHIGSYLNEGFLIPFLTPVEYLEFVASLHGRNRSDLDSFLHENASFYNDDILSGKFIRQLSSGNKNKIGILAAMLSSPELIILDEPFANLDPGSQLWLKEKLRTFHNSGMTIIISSHDLRQITDLCSRIIVLEDGKIVLDVNTGPETLHELEKYFGKGRNIQ